MNSIKKEIIQTIKKNNGAFYGKIVQRLRYPNSTILKNLIELKSKGIIYKDNDGGRYKVDN